MWKYLTITLLFLAGLVYAGYYLYMFDKRQPAQAIQISEKTEKPTLPPHLTKSFWKTTTPQELETQLKRTANVNEVRPNDKQSMLHLLVQYGAYPEMVKMLVDAGVDYKLKDEAIDSLTGELDNKTALFYAIFRKDQAYEFIQALLEHDNVNSYVNNDATALIIAVYTRSPLNIIQLLLKEGADPNIKTLLTSSNSLIAASFPNKFTGVTSIDPQVVQLLLDHNGSATSKDTSGKSALDYMKENEEFKKTELFKKLSAQFSEPVEAK